MTDEYDTLLDDDIPLAEPKARGELVMVHPEHLAKLEAENKFYRELFEQLDKVHTFAVAYVFLRERGAPVQHVDAGYRELKTALAEHGHWFRDEVKQAIKD